MARHARLVVEPLADWPYPAGPTVPSPFRTRDRDASGRPVGPQRPVPWTTTRDELLREADHLGARQVVLELDCTRAQLRQDGEIKASARLASGRVRVSMETRHGPMRWALARYDDAGLSWAANVRGIVLTLDALRAVDRYGAVADGQQYRGFLAIEAPAQQLELTDPDGARAWLHDLVGARDSVGSMLREARRRELVGDQAQQLAVVERTLTGAGSAAS